MIGGWTLSQLFPLVPSLDIGNLRHGLAPIARLITGDAPFDASRFATYLLYLGGLAVIARIIVRPFQPALTAFLAFALVVLALKVPIVTRQLSVESILGTIGGVVVAALLGRLPPRVMAWFGAALIASGFLVAQIATVPGGTLTPFNWVPFGGHLENPLIGIESILETLWPAAALAYLTRSGVTEQARTPVAWIGGLLLVVLCFALEFHQQRLPGRVGDITTVVLMTVTWAVCWRMSATSRERQLGYADTGRSLDPRSGLPPR